MVMELGEHEVQKLFFLLKKQNKKEVFKAKWKFSKYASSRFTRYLCLVLPAVPVL